LNDSGTLQRHLDTRFLQLTVAKDMELWQECFRTVEDIHNLLELSEMTPDPKMITRYFGILNNVLMVGENYLFHSAAYQKYFFHRRDNEEISKSDFSKYGDLK
jgi:translation initiation factor 3 subunit A